MVMDRLLAKLVSRLSLLQAQHDIHLSTLLEMLRVGKTVVALFIILEWLRLGHRDEVYCSSLLRRNPCCYIKRHRLYQFLNKTLGYPS